MTSLKSIVKLLVSSFQFPVSTDYLSLLSEQQDSKEESAEMFMKCRYSGAYFRVEGFSTTSIENGEHPMMEASLELLLRKLIDWSAGKLSEKESRILFTCFLKRTDLVEFRCPVDPSVVTVQKYMEPLVRTVAWMDRKASNMRLPRYAVSLSNKDLSNIGIWITAWQEVRNLWYQRHEDIFYHDERLKKEELLYRLIKSPFKTTEDYAGHLANWALQVSETPVALVDFWRSIFRAKDMEIFNLRPVDVEELYQHMIDNLPAGSPITNTVLRHLSKIRAKNRAGLNFSLGMLEEDESLDPVEEAQHPYKIVRDSVEEENRKIIAATITEIEEPKESDIGEGKKYPTRIKFIIARSQWNIWKKEEAKKIAEEEAVLAAEKKREELERELPTLDELEEVSITSNEQEIEEIITSLSRSSEQQE